MKLHLVNRGTHENSAFMVTHHKEPYFLKVWHYHPELELVLTMQSTGTRFVGDSIKKFDGGDLVLIGKNLPHMWFNDDHYFEEDSDLIAEDIVVHFRREFLGADFFEIQEMSHISKLLDRSRYGIKFLNVTMSVLEDVKMLTTMDGFERTIKFIQILNDLAHYDQFELLASEGYINSFKKTQNKTLDRIYEYIFENFSRPIYLEDVARLANMNPSAFSRYFKRINRKTFSSYLNEVRIGYACKLLIERKANISAICYESGFNNISNFNRQFKAIMQKSPTEYLRHYTTID